MEKLVWEDKQRVSKTIKIAFIGVMIFYSIFPLIFLSILIYEIYFKQPFLRALTYTLLFFSIEILIYWIILKKHRVVCISASGIIVPKITKSVLVKKEDINSIILGRYSKISKFGRDMTYAGVAVESIATALGNLNLIAGLGMNSVARSNVAIIKKGDETFAPIITDLYGFVQNLKKIGITLKGEHSIFVYSKK